MRLSDGVEAAIHSVAMLARLEGDAVLPASALADYHGLSPSYLLKHMQALSGAGLVETVPGPKGGYRLARGPEAISLLDVVLAIEGRQPAFRCAEIRQRGPDPLPRSLYLEPCGINAAMLAAERAYRAELARVSIAALKFAAAPDNERDRQLAGRECRFLAARQRPQTPPAPNPKG